MRRFKSLLLVSAILAISIGTYTSLTADTRMPIARRRIVDAGWRVGDLERLDGR